MSTEIHDVSQHYDMKLIVLWINQIGSGLQYLHEHEILHRDVKPKNILLAAREHLKLADFGLARNISHENTDTSGQGTDPYMAPEIVVMEVFYSEAADVYSFGVTIWEMICRKYPSKHLQVGNDGIELPIDLEEMSEDSWNFVKRCWQKEISDRPSIQEIINFEPKFDQTILVVGGGLHNNKMTIWNRKTSTWTVSRMKFPGHIRSFGVVYLDDELYISNWDKSFFKLDKNMELKQLADMNEKRGYISNSCLEWNGYIWVFGGWNWDREEALKSVERYDPKEDKWTRMPDMTYVRCRAAAAVCNGKIYICGGIGDSPVYLKSVECFDPESGVWTGLTDMPTPRSRHFLVCYRNKLVVIGGWDEKQETTTVLELDPLEKNGQWKELSPLLYTSLASVGVVLDREIITIGWDNTNDSDSPDVEIFDGINWRVSPSFPLALEYYLPPSAVLVPQEFADRLFSYSNDLTLLSSVKHTSDGVPYQTLKDFKLKEQLGSGGYGTVWKGSELNRFALKKRIVAVKIFNGWDVYAEREIQILKTHTHEHIVQLFGVIWDEKDKDDPTKKPIYTGYVMEYLELGSLHKEIHDLSKSYDVALILLWVKQIGSGLHYLHGNGIIHRDVKPSNILLLRIDHIKLADFGLARNISYQQSCTTGPIGTNVYMAPEVRTSKDYGVPADVYSFGVTIWEITQRKKPWEHVTISTDSSGIVSTELIMDADETYGGLTDLVKRCWQRNISDRPSIQEIINFEPKFDQTILVVGGGRYDNEMTIWNRGTSTWTVSRMELVFPDLILSFGVVYLDDELYLTTHGKKFFKLDKNMKWKRLADMNEGRVDIKNSCLEWNGYIWVYGGWNGNREEVLKSVERYDPKEDKWTLMPDMKYGRSDPAAAVCNGKIYICGGWRDGNARLKSVECLDPESGVWTELTDMPTPRYHHSLVCYRNKLVVLGGEDGRKGTTVLELDPLEKNGQWKEMSPLTSPSSVSVAAVLGREIITISHSHKVQIFDGINWRVGPYFPSIIPDSLSAVLVPQEFADRLPSYPIGLKIHYFNTQ